MEFTDWSGLGHVLTHLVGGLGSLSFICTSVWGGVGPSKKKSRCSDQKTEEQASVGDRLKGRKPKRDCLERG